MNKEKEKYASLSFPILGDYFQPELSSLPRFRIKGGPLGLTDGGQRNKGTNNNKKNPCV